MSRNWGGRREGAGRKPAGKRAGVPHAPRARIRRTTPVHVTLRMAPHVYNLRTRKSFRVVQEALIAASNHLDMKILEFSVQGDHVHLLAETRDDAALSRAMKGLSVRLARGLNKMMGTRGSVLGDRYHAHVLRTPTEVVRAREYIKACYRKHATERGHTLPAGFVDPYSSAAPGVRQRLGLPAPGSLASHGAPAMEEDTA